MPGAFTVEIYPVLAGFRAEKWVYLYSERAFRRPHLASVDVTQGEPRAEPGPGHRPAQDVVNPTTPPATGLTLAVW